MTQDNREKPGAQTPWNDINQLLAPDERFEVKLPNWEGFLLAPKQSAQLAALLYLLHQHGLPFSVHGRGTATHPEANKRIIVSARAFTQVYLQEDGVVEVGAGCTIAQLHGDLFARKFEVSLEGDPVTSAKRSVGGILLSGRTAGIQLRQELFPSTILGIELVTWEGSQLKWGSSQKSAGAGPNLHKLIWGLQSLPAIITKVVLKAYPIPPVRLRLFWSWREANLLWKHFHALKSFSTTWERLDCVFSSDPQEKKIILAQIAGLPEEMEAFKRLCPFYQQAEEKDEAYLLKKYFSQQQLKSYPTNIEQELLPGEYLWCQGLDQRAWLITHRFLDEDKVQPYPVWKQRLWKSLFIHKQPEELFLGNAKTPGVERS